MKQLLEWLDAQIETHKALIETDREEGYNHGSVDRLEEVRDEVAALIAQEKPGSQYGLRHVDGREVIYPDRDTAAATQQRMRAWPTTKWVKLIRRDYHVGPWETVN